MKINFVEARSIITKSNIPSIDYVINPYTGCQHRCIYCYAEFIKRFTNHTGEDWGSFLDVKQFNFNSIKPGKYNNKRILLSSVTDPYCPLEIKFKCTRRILERLIGTKAFIQILTKSRHVVRDIDLFRKFKNIEVGISINTLDADFARIIEPLASKPQERIEALREISQNGIPTYIFISPMFPKITDWKEIMEQTSKFTNSFRFENLNFRPHNISRIKDVISQYYPELVEYYEQIKQNPLEWDVIEDQIKEYCNKLDLHCRIEFHHGGFSKLKQKKRSKKSRSRSNLQKFLNQNKAQINRE